MESVLNTADFLNKNGIKPSYQRIRIFDLLRNNKNHPTVDQIYQELAPEMPTLSKTTIYNTLNLFFDRKIVLVITIEENETRYDADTSVHGHFKCVNCGAIYDFNTDLSDITPDKLAKYKITEKHLYFKGVCKNCLAD